MQRHGIRRQVRPSSSESTPHDRVTILQICSSRSLALDRPRQSALRYPAVRSNRASTYSVRRQPAPIHTPLRSRTTSAIAPPTISHSARGTQIPITHAAPPTNPFARFPPLKVCGRRPRCARHHLHEAGIRKPSQYQKSPVYRSTRHHDRGGATPEAQNYSITSLALASNVGGICTPSAFAVLRLMTSSIIVGCSTGRSAGFAPLRILST